MSAVGTLTAVVLAVVLAYAGVSKWRTPIGTESSFASLGLPVPHVLARVVPVAELGAGVVLVAAPRIGGILALAMLGSFTVVLALRLSQGVTVGCACFGRADAPPLSPVELFRNAVLLALAATALAAPVPVMPTFEAVVLVSAGLVVGGVVVALAQLRRDIGAVFATDLPGEMA
ncbi:MAG: DoxX family protein [Acidimicrobiia bacterium]|nr:DoxX family protein [Acidimicrobiia bacterium]